jgi:predicted dehydrogenase
MTVKVAIAGTGFIAGVHAAAVRNTPGAELVAVVNHRPGSMQAFADHWGVSRQYRDVGALLADGDVDALIVGTPNYLHAPQSMAALQAGVHVLVEKPMAMDVAEATSMVATARQSSARLMVAQCWRFDEEVLWLRAQVMAGRLGEIVRTKGYGIHSLSGPAGWFTEKALAGGGALVDMGIHAIDTARFLLGDPEPASVYAWLATGYGDYDVDDTGMLLITWDNGAASYVESGWWQPHKDGPEAATQLYGRKGFGQVFPTWALLLGKEQPVKLDPGYPYPREEHCPQTMYDAEFGYFVSSILEGWEPVPGGAEGLALMRIIGAAYESAASRKVVQL